MGTLKNISNELEGVHYSILQEYLEKGDKVLIENPEMILYLEQLDKIRGWHYSLMTENKVINALLLDYKGLSRREAKTRYADAINYFYGDTTIKKEAHRNMVADEMYKAYTAAILSAKEPKDYKIAVDILFKSIEVRGSMESDPDQLPDHILEKKTPVYVIDPEWVGLPKANRNLLAEQIDAMPITEFKKIKLKQEAGIESLQIFDEDES